MKHLLLRKHGTSCFQDSNIRLWQLKKLEVDSSIISNEEICGETSSNNKI